MLYCVIFATSQALEGTRAARHVFDATRVAGGTRPALRAERKLRRGRNAIRVKTEKTNLSAAGRKIILTTLNFNAMAAKEPTQKAKLALKAIPYSITSSTNNDYYVTPKIQKNLNIEDLAAEVAALSTRQEDPDDIARVGKALLRRMMWYLSSGYSISTELGNFRVTAKGVLMEQELVDAPDRSRISLGVSYSMSDAMREALAESELDIEIQKAAVGPQLYSVVSGHDANNPDAVTRGESVPVSAGQVCIIKGKNLKVGGTGENIGITLRRVDGSSGESYFYTAAQLYPNTTTRVGFVMPASAPEESEWEITLCTQIGANGSAMLKEPRTAVLPDTFVVGETTETPGGGGEEEGGGGAPLG